LDLVEQLYEKINNTIPEIKGKVFIPLSGGLDSRVMAGIINNRQPIDLSYVHFKVGSDTRHVSYSTQIADELDIKKYYVIPIYQHEIDYDFNHVSNLPKTESYTAFKKLSDIVNLKEYTLIMPHGMEYMTGIHITQFDLFYSNKNKKIDDWYLNIWRPIETKWVEFYKSFFKDIITTWQDDLVNYCLNLPLKYRCNQRLYRQMIIRYFPKLASIPRDTMNFRIDQGEFKYTLNRLRYSICKLWS